MSSTPTPVTVVVIDASGDLIVRISEYDEEVSRPYSEHPVISQIVDFQVSREVLANKSLFFKKLLRSSNFAEASKDKVSLEGDRVKSMDIWFRILHAVDVENLGAVEVEEMWSLAAACDKYDLDIGELKDWFALWYDMQNMTRCRPSEMLYPCWIFDHAKGFAAATKSLAYDETGHITERNPTNHYELHLPSRVIQQINAAKGRLRTILHSGLFEPNEELLVAGCPCRKETLYDYEKTLWQIKVWPLERIAQRNSMTVILNRLSFFNYKPQKEACRKNCQRDYKTLVDRMERRTRNYFDGLCLDCMDKSKPKTGDADMDYWRHHTLGEDDWVTTCRFPHKQATWYFSFMGRREDRDRFREKKKAENRNRDGLIY